MLQHAQLYDFRCFSQLSLDFNPRLTVISGKNGAGKTSLLEAIYHLSSFRSFRTREIQPLISDGCDYFVVRGIFEQNETVIVKKALKTASSILVDNKAVNTTSILARKIPMTIVHQGLFELIDGGSSARRMTLDWGLFHVEHRYHETLSSYNHALKQRNALLKRAAPYTEIEPWDALMSKDAEILSTMREKYLCAVSPIFESVLQRCAGMHCTLDFIRGWGRKEQADKSLAEYLRAHFEQDSKHQNTRYGAHAADVRFIAERSAKKEFSRGQQKLLFIAFKLAQISLLERPTIVLLDDVFAELDSERQQRVMHELSVVTSQVIMTTLDPKTILNNFSDKDYQHILLA